MADLIYDETELFLVCILLGMVLAFVYDIFRILRLFLSHKDWVVDLEDLSFWLFTAWMVFRTLFVYNRGALRGYAFLGMILGVLLYVLTLSHLLLSLAEKIVPYWNRFKEMISNPFLKLWEFVIKGLKNMVADVKMAIKGR